jgi:TonB family protein
MARALLIAIALSVLASPPRVIAEGHVILTPQLVDAMRRFTTYAPLPDYPKLARAHHMQGNGMYLLHVRTDGAVERVDVVESTGHRELDDACVAAYRQWRFRRDFAAKAHKVKIPVTFANP